jgi:predicted nucleic acid-binding protein
VKAFFDTSVLVGAFYGDHPRHAACLRLLADGSKKTHCCAAHAVAELYAVMTRLPVRPRITPEQGLLFVENVRDHFSVIILSAAEQFEAAADAARRGLGGGKVYDLLTLKCALKAGAEQIYTLNPQEFARLAFPEIRDKLATVP